MAARWNLRFAPHLSFPSTDEPYFLHQAGTADPIDQIAYVATSFQPLWGHPGVTEQLERIVRTGLDAARRAGGRHIVVVTGRDPDRSVEAQLAQMVENLQGVAPIAEEAGVALCLEMVNARSVPGFLLQRLHHVEAIVRAVDSPAVRLVFDNQHVRVMEGEVVSSFDRVQDLVAVVQLSGYPGRGLPGASERALLQSVVRSGYRGLVELEHHHASRDVAGEDRTVDALRALDAAVLGSGG